MRDAPNLPPVLQPPKKKPAITGALMIMGGVLLFVLVAGVATGLLVSRYARSLNGGDTYDPRLVAGADPFALKGVDLAGQPVSVDEYKGRVLMIDFWATWCGPCVAEVPNVVAAYEKYHGQGFEILGVSLDQEGMQAGLAQFLKEKNMTWRQIYDGKYWEAENARTYGVQAIPFTLLIGRDGKIAAVDIRGSELAPAIEAALARSSR